ncbi:MAG TPA: O-antigen ligase family protein, partial [Candidatus Polarisedimenticolia bacterium]|nr:O-antigen ligase family protein [Candidatus Polarisedimenticolia bacterium]
RRRDRRIAALWSGAVLLHLGALLPLQSRGVLVALACGGAVLTAAVWRDLPGRGKGILAAVLLVTMTAGGLLVARRFAENDDPDRFTRVPIWKSSLAMAFERPVLGLGPGQFAHEAPRHNFPLERSPVRYGRQFAGAHSFPLTLLAEEGIPGLLLAAALGIGLAATLLRAARRGNDLLLGAAAALTAFGAQAFVEDLQDRPAVLMTAALLAGSACAVARGWRMRPQGAGIEPDAARRAKLDPLPAGALLLVAACVVAGGVVRPWLAWREAAAARALGEEGLPRLRRAAAIDPFNPWHREGLAMAALQGGGPPDRARYAAAAIELDTALQLAPREPRLLLLRARLEAVAARSLLPAPATIDRAAALYEEAARNAPCDPRPRLEQAGFLAEQGRTGEARATLQAALLLEPNYRRARLLLADLDERDGKEEDAGAALDALLASDAALRDYVPDSPYAAEIVRDAPAERQRITSRVRNASASKQG